MTTTTDPATLESRRWRDVAGGGDVIQTSSPTVWRRWLAFEMKRMRQRAGLSQADIARVLGSQVPKISLMEKGRRNVQRRDLEKLLPLFDVPQEHWDNYFTAADNAHKKGWWEIYDDRSVPGWQKRFIGLEQGAERIRTYQPAVLPGLFQTPEYAAAILQRTAPYSSQAKIEQLVEVRTHRQLALWRDVHPLRLSAIVDEAALRRVVGSRDVMRAQVEHLATVVAQCEHVDFRVVPFSRGGAYEAAYGAFVILTFGWPTDPGVVYIEHPKNAEFLETLDATEDYSALFQGLEELALSSDQSVEMLRASVDEFN
jgi:transcriptional regulator with XRE-family HTH domain